MILKKGEFSVAGRMWSTIQRTSLQPVDHSRFVGRPPGKLGWQQLTAWPTALPYEHTVNIIHIWTLSLTINFAHLYSYPVKLWDVSFAPDCHRLWTNLSCPMGMLFPNQQSMNSFTTDARWYLSLDTSDKNVTFPVALICLLVSNYAQKSSERIFVKFS